MRLPRRGERYRCISEVAVQGIVGFRGVPVSQSCEGTLPGGTIIEILSDPSERSTAVSCRPAQYRKFESALVSADDRAEAHYDGYYLVIPFTELAAKFQLLGQDT